jgi:hypothetical protein
MHRILAVNADGGRLPQRPDRRRRAGRDGVRQLGRRAGRRRLPGIQPGLHGARAGRLKRTGPTACRCRASSSPRAAGCGWTPCASSTATCWASTGRSTWPARRARRRSAAARRCRATSTPTCCSRRRRRSRPKRAKVLDEFGAPHTGRRHRADAHLQPGPRHQPAHAAGARDGAGGGGARAFRAVARLQPAAVTPRHQGATLADSAAAVCQAQKRLTYAQKACCGARSRGAPLFAPKTDSAAKSLILLGFEFCFFSGHSSQALDFRGSGPACRALSTKLSTETLDVFKALESTT